ncbi:MAG TPA: hypothetical protein VGB92_10820 [Longimicrobium sp.]|jgi:hypothetical protein
MRKLQIKTLADRIGGGDDDMEPWMEDSAAPCYKDERTCQTTCLFRVECCCYYRCNSGGTWVCKDGYCSNTSHSCP